jgi:hypothetical protein
MGPKPGDELVRLVIVVPAKVRHKMKKRALDRRLTLRDYILALAEADGAV